MERRKWSRGNERGQALILAVLGMAVFLGFVAMAVDVGLLLNERRTLQNAADAAALAGAIELPYNPPLAILKALEWAENNGIDPTEIESITVGTTNVTNDTIYVDLDREFDWIFGRVVGLDQSDVGAHAAALIGSPVGIGGLKPWAVTEEVFLALIPGDQATLKFDANDVQDGNFQPIRLDGQGSNVYRDNVKYGSETVVCVLGQEQPGCPSVVPTETGNVIGPTNQSVGWLEQQAPDSCNEFGEVFTPDPNNPGEYLLTASCNPWSTSQPATLVAIVPVIDSLCNGNCDVTILRFAMFFIEGITCQGQGQGNSCTVTGTYVKAAVDVEALIGPYDPLGSLYFVRLIQ